jgi:hypothetical protein
MRARSNKTGVSSRHQDSMVDMNDIEIGGIENFEGIAGQDGGIELVNFQGDNLDM